MLLSLFLTASMQADLPAIGAWRAWLDSPGGELAFGLELDRSGESWTAALTNGDERIEIPRVVFAYGELVLDFVHYDSRIVASVDGGELSGEWVKTGSGGKFSRLPFHARHSGGGSPANAAPEVDVAGRWAVDFASDELQAVGVFEQRADGQLTGTFLTATGDYRFLDGRVRGRELTLSCFDGAHAFLFRANLDGEDRLQGEFWSRDSWHETWQAERDPNAALADGFHQTVWQKQASLADLVFPDLDGEMRSIGDPAYAGKARIVQLFGSWCPNCHDEAPYLAELDRRYRSRGLSIIGIAFELTGDFERDARQVRRYKERHGVEYPLFVAGLADKTKATESFPAIDFLRSYPTTIFFDGAGRVRSVHSGFAGPATGAAHTELRASYESLIEELLSEAPVDDSTIWESLLEGPWYSRAEFAGATTTFFEDDDGSRFAHYVLLGSGRPVLDTKELPVTVAGDAVRVGERVFRFDTIAGVLLDPGSVQGRLTTTDSGAGWILERRQLDTEEQLLQALTDADSRVRREALVRLVREREVSANGRLREALALLTDSSPDVRLHAIWAMGRLGETEAREPLQEMLTSQNRAVRREAAVALARINN